MKTASDRFHALDATRAFALLLGVVFHAAWTYLPWPSGAPIVDVSGNIGFDWFFFTSHTFRMQLFFLIAGFFARMLYQRRGLAGFANHRFKRIGLPLVLGWLILYPLIVATWTWGANVSGRNLTEVPIGKLLAAMYGLGLAFAPRSSGGLFGLGHLWFLYYLLWLYFAAVALRFAAMRAVPASVGLRARADRMVARVVDSPWSVVGLSLATGLFLWRMGGWFGVDTPVHTLVPSAPVLLLYGTFFGFGWLLHRQTGLLSRFARHWKWQIPTGLLLSVVIFAGFHRLNTAGVAGGPTSGRYPLLWPTQIGDWPGFLDRLKSGAGADASDAALGRLWQAIPEESRTAILTLPADTRPDVRVGVCQALNKLLVQPGLFGNEGPSTAAFEDGRSARRANPGPGLGAAFANRRGIERVFAGTVAGDPRDLSWYWPVKLGYSIGYAVIMWLLVLGCLGVFHDWFPEHSRAWRYVADSSYWIYLLHIPLVPALQIWTASWAWPGVLKFATLNVVSFGLLFASYHYLVRSTFIGQLLNGRRYPFVAWPFTRRAPARGSDPADSLEEAPQWSGSRLSQGEGGVG